MKQKDVQKMMVLAGFGGMAIGATVACIAIQQTKNEKERIKNNMQPVSGRMERLLSGQLSQHCPNH